MDNQIFEFFMDESKWMTISMLLAFMTFGLVYFDYRKSIDWTQHRIQLYMNLFFGIMIGTMAFGHLFAITVKIFVGSLEGSVYWLYLIGASLALPSWFLIMHTLSLLMSEDRPNKKPLYLNLWSVLTLLVFELHNLPLAFSGILNIAFQLHSGKKLGRVIVCTFVVFNVVLFVGSIIFFLSGQSFEQFSGME